VLNEDGEVVDRGRFRTTPKALKKWFPDQPPTRVVMEAGTRSIWISGQLQELGHEVIVANVRELRARSHSNRRSDRVDAEKLARLARAWTRRFCLPTAPRLLTSCKRKRLPQSGFVQTAM